MTSPLDNLAGTSGSLRKESPDAEEYAGLIRSATVRLVDAENTDNSVESRFDLAYNAAHALCLAAMRHAGYRANNASSSSRRCRIRYGSVQRYGEFSRNATRSGTGGNTRAT
jgi:hypothetical protein